jgi:head-tail adaptor
MRAGKLNQRVRVERPIRTVDDYGAQRVTWEHVTDLWCNVGTETKVEDRDHGGEPVTYGRFDTRWTDAIEAGHRIVYRGQAFEVRTIEEVGRRLAMTVMGEARAS